jgi:ATP-dependent RNA helicase RhlE
VEGGKEGRREEGREGGKEGKREGGKEGESKRVREQGGLMCQRDNKRRKTYPD